MSWNYVILVLLLACGVFAVIAGDVLWERWKFKREFPEVWALVIGDMEGRDQLGRERYGRPLTPHNGRDALKDAYEEALDLAVYLRQALYERDGA